MSSLVPKTDAERLAELERALAHERAARKRVESLLARKSQEFSPCNGDLENRCIQNGQGSDEIEYLRAALQTAQLHVVRSASLASLGQLAAGVAHEISNPVGFIKSNLGTLKTYLEVMSKLICGYRDYTANTDANADGTIAALRHLEQSQDIDYILKDVAELIAESSEGTRRIDHIAKGLKCYSGIDGSELGKVDLHKAIDTTLNIVVNETKYNCEIVKQYGRLSMVPCKLHQVIQVFTNLFINAAQSIEDQGKITVTTWTDGAFAVVEIRDTGSGISQDDIGLIFDPFFTTRPNGSGLGLSISHDIIGGYGGRIFAESDVGVGTAVIVQLPIETFETGAT